MLENSGKLPVLRAKHDILKLLVFSDQHSKNPTIFNICLINLSNDWSKCIGVAYDGNRSIRL